MILVKVIEMANAKWHVSSGLFIAYPFVVVIWLLVFGAFHKVDIAWLATGWFITGSVATMPDWDLLLPKIFGEHRSIITHSWFIPTILFGLTYFLMAPDDFVTLIPWLCLIFSAHGLGHMFLDVGPVWEGGNAIQMAKWAEQGLTGEQRYKKSSGTWLVHLPWSVKEEVKGKKGKIKTVFKRTFSPRASRDWYIACGLWDILLIFLTLNAATHWIWFFK